MKYIKLFENFKDKSDLEKELDRYGIKNYTINSDGTIDVDGDVNLSLLNLEKKFSHYKFFTKLPFRFGKVSGDFLCYSHNLETLYGSPYYVGGSFSCSDNNLTSLEFCPKHVDDNFICRKNKIVSLKNSPIEIGGSFDCSDNIISSLDGMPLEIGKSFVCNRNKIKILDSISNIEGEIHCDNIVDSKYFRGYCKKIVKINI